MFPKNPFAVFSLLFVLVLACGNSFAESRTPSAGVVFEPAFHSLLAIDTFTVGPAWLSATSASITGRVKTPQGRPIMGASIVLKDANTNAVVRTTLSSNFGFYKLHQIETGHSYVLSVWHKRYLFAFPAHLIDINEDRSGVDFIGEEAH